MPVCGKSSSPRLASDRGRTEFGHRFFDTQDIAETCVMRPAKTGGWGHPRDGRLLASARPSLFRSGPRAVEAEIIQSCVHQLLQIAIRHLHRGSGRRVSQRVLFVFSLNGHIQVPSGLDPVFVIWMASARINRRHLSLLGKICTTFVRGLISSLSLSSMLVDIMCLCCWHDN